MPKADDRAVCCDLEGDLHGAGKVQNGIHVATGVISPVSAFSGADGTVLFVR